MKALPSALLGLLPLSLAQVSAGDAKSALSGSGGSDWDYSFSIGQAVRQAGNFGFAGGSRSGSTVIPSFVGSNILTPPPIGDATLIGERTYNDGFVGLDNSTAGDGLTANWGYQSSGQVTGDTLAFQATGFQSIRQDQRLSEPSLAFDESERTLAPVLHFEGRSRHFIHGIQLGFSTTLVWSALDLNERWSDFQLTQGRDDFRRDWTDEYNLGGFGALIPSAPFSGSAGGPGFLLENIPDSRTLNVVQIGSEGAVLSNDITTRIEGGHATFSFGPTFTKQVNESWNFVGSVGLAVHWVQFTARQEETLSVSQGGTSREFRSWSDTTSKSRFLGGAYLQVGAEWTPPAHNIALQGFMRADFGQEFATQVGPTRINYDPDGLSAGLLMSLPF